MKLKIFGKSVLIAFGLFAIVGGVGALCAYWPWFFVILVFIAITAWIYIDLSKEEDNE